MGRTTIIGIIAAVGVLLVVIVVGGMMYEVPPARKAVPVERDADYSAPTPRSRSRPVAAPLFPPPPQSQPAQEEPPAAIADVPQPPPVKPSDRPAAARQQPAPQRPGGKRPPQNPEARSALSRVGVDPLAEVVWLGAINDPDLPAEERKDLIEDLNEDGFPDHNNITPADLPLIVSRLALIEELGPTAMDDVNAEAFREAYKDLVNMFMRVAGQ
jgi:hypothetical protein